MAEIKWIKIKTDIFDDEKIKIIDRYPARDEILVIWFKLLSLAGKVNQNGYLFLSHKIAYTTDMLSAIFNREENTIKMALKVFEQFGMIDIEDNEVIKISNWDKHQNIEGLEKIREQNKLRKQRQREKEKQLLLENSHVKSRDSHAIEEDKELDKELDKEKEEDIKKMLSLIVEKWNSLNLTQIKSIKTNSPRFKSAKARISENGIEEVLKAIESINHSDFLKGVNDKQWQITFDWLMKPTNFDKVIEGNYLNKGASKNASGERNNQKTEWELSELAKAEQFKGRKIETVDF